MTHISTTAQVFNADVGVTTKPNLLPYIRLEVKTLSPSKAIVIRVFIAIL